jgi:RNA polymerase sigma-54 factor
MELGLRITPKQIQTLKPTQQQLQYYRLLQQTNLEIEDDIRDELAQNPALEIEEIRRCPRCGEIVLEGHPCTTCIAGKADDSDREEIRSEKLDMLEEIYSSSEGNYEASTYEAIPDDELPDAFATVVRAITLEEHLKSRLALDLHDLSPDDRMLAEELIDRIDAGPESATEVEPITEPEDYLESGSRPKRGPDNPGLIKASDEELAKDFGVPVNRLASIRRRIAEMDPVGSGLASSVDVLALQAELATDLLPEERTALALILRKHLKDISKERYASVAKKVKLPAKRVKELIEYTRRNFHVHPRRRFEEDESNAQVENPYITADVRIRDVDGTFVVEVLDSGLPVLKLSKYYMESYRKLRANRNAFNPDERKHIKEYFERATTYIQNINARRQTMLDITTEIVNQQEAYLRHGPLYLKKLTRKQVAEAIGVHPSTVSRALAVRYCWLPDNSIVPFSVFFNPSLCYIEMIKQILKTETHEKVLSDEEIRDIMLEKGHDLSRRVITKYRKKGRIPPSGRRKRLLTRQWLKDQSDGSLLDEDLLIEDETIEDEDLEDETNDDEDELLDEEDEELDSDNDDEPDEELEEDKDELVDEKDEQNYEGLLNVLNPKMCVDDETNSLDHTEPEAAQ